MPKFQISDVCSAFDTHTIGTKVTADKVEFMRVIMDAVSKHDPEQDREPGQHFVMLPKEATEMVSCGVGRHTGHQDDYVVRIHRDEPGVFLTRVNAAECTGVAVVVYTRDAYEADPQVTPERMAALDDDTAYVVVAILGFADAPKPEVSSHRFVRNLAGGNHEYDILRLMARWDADNLPENRMLETDDSIARSKELERLIKEQAEHAKRVVEYEQTWCTVSD